MLKLCNYHGKCLLLETARRYQYCQPGLRLAYEGDSKTISDVIARLIEAKRNGNRRLVYLQSLSRYLSRFAAGREQQSIEDFSAHDIEEWLANFPAPYSRQTWLSRISTLFAFAVRRGFISKNPCSQVERVTIDKKAPVILTVQQAQTLLAATPTVCKPWLVLAMFAGIRPDGELMNVLWEDINLETKSVRIERPKVRKHKRIVPLEPITVELLRQHPLRTGKIAPSASTVRRFKRRMRAVLGFTHWPKDVLRHTAASYLMAKYRNAGNVSAWLGNSPDVLMNHYHEPVAEVECEKFWKLKTF